MILNTIKKILLFIFSFIFFFYIFNLLPILPFNEYNGQIMISSGDKFFGNDDKTCPINPYFCLNMFLKEEIYLDIFKLNNVFMFFLFPITLPLTLSYLLLKIVFPLKITDLNVFSKTEPIFIKKESNIANRVFNSIFLINFLFFLILLICSIYLKVDDKYDSSFSVGLPTPALAFTAILFLIKGYEYSKYNLIIFDEQLLFNTIRRIDFSEIKEIKLEENKLTIFLNIPQSGFRLFSNKYEIKYLSKEEFNQLEIIFKNKNILINQQ